VTVKHYEKARISGKAALWAEATIANDGVTAARLMQENPREIVLGLLAVPGEWRKWSDVATRGLIPTASPMTNLYEVCKLLKNIERELLVFGNADPAVMAMHDKVSELADSAIEVFGETYKAVHRKIDALGPDIAEAVMPGWELQPECL
jgi:hypothetical protein